MKLKWTRTGDNELVAAGRFAVRKYVSSGDKRRNTFWILIDGAVEVATRDQLKNIKKVAERILAREVAAAAVQP